MIQTDFNFQLGHPGDHRRVEWLKLDLMQTATKAIKEGNLLAAMRDITRVQNLLGSGTLIGLFVSKEIISGNKGSSISTAEAWTAYELEMLQGRQPTLTKREFERLLPVAMRTLHGVARAATVVRNGKQCRGYFGVNLKTPLPPQNGITS